MDAEIWKVGADSMMLWLIGAFVVLSLLATPTVVLAVSFWRERKENQAFREWVRSQLLQTQPPPVTAPLRAALAKVAAPAAAHPPALPMPAAVDEAHFGPGSRASSPVPEEPRGRRTVLPRS